jgi:hypothetical protein
MYTGFSIYQLSIYELSVVLLARNQNPTLLNWDFLRYSGIVPQDWELAATPIYTQEGTQLIFNNGLRIVSDSSRTVFLENVIGKPINDMLAAKIAQLYTQVLPYAEYEGMGINITGVVTFQEQPQIAHNYLAKNLLAYGNWLEFGTQPAKVDLNISYTLEQGNLNLQINQIDIPQENQEDKIPAIRFFGNFDYALQEVQQTDRLGILQTILYQWRSHIESFTSLINQRFFEVTNLQQTAS